MMGILIITHHYSILHLLSSASHQSHAKMTKFLMKELALFFPQDSLAVHDTCN